MVEASTEIHQYFKDLNDGVLACYDLAAKARKKGLDPEETVPIPLAKNMAERVVGLISVVAPIITNTTITSRILELEKEYGTLDWRVGFKIAEEVAKESFCKFETKLEAMEVGIRVGFAYLTLGIVSAPLEGFIGLKIKKRKDGKEYFALQYAGPIRGAGGTAASTSVLLSDYVRVKMGYSTYDPDENEINRYVIEISDYHERVTNLQYRPSEEELRFMISHLPVEVDGDPTETIEVSNYKDLPRIESNLIRGGMCLVLAEGLSQKAPKLWKRLSKWGKSFDLEWDFLEDFIKLKEKIHAAHSSKSGSDVDGGKKTVKANNTFIMDSIAGRPILTHPLAPGGFRLRYGRSRASGFSATALHPATMIVLNKFIAIGTQLKVERPGKAASVTVCDSIEGPIVRLKSGDLLQFKTEEEAKKLAHEVDEIVFLGDILFNYGDFSENGQLLVPAGYCPEWWALELEAAVKKWREKESSEKTEKLCDKIEISEERLQQLIQEPFTSIPTWEEASLLATTLNFSLHPNYLFYWKLVSGKDLFSLVSWLKEGRVKRDEQGISKIVLPYSDKQESYIKGKKCLDFMGLPHTIVNKENVVLARNEANSLAFSFGFKDQAGLDKLELDMEKISTLNGLETINLFSPVESRDKAGTFIGARMGRPEKAKMRLMTGSPQVMFPVGEEGDRLRSFQSALQSGKVQSIFPTFFCEKCQKDMIYHSCEECGQLCIKKFNCRNCGELTQETCRHGQGSPYKLIDLDIKYYFEKAKSRLKENVHPDLIKGVRGTSNKEHLVEHLAKGILRAKHNIYVNKDGTTRYDCTELPLTHFKPKEIKTSIKKLHELGYNKDIYGKKLVVEDQLLEIKPQDLILPGFDSLDESAPQVLKRVAAFVDDLLVNFYGLEPYYTITKDEDLVGHLVIGLAPHISAGLIGRIIGFSETQGLITHPMYHAGLRRDCDGDEACVMLLMDALLNFSRQYLPERRGAKTMDSPLVLTNSLYPTEVDDQVHGIDVVWKYPLELYMAALEMKAPWEVKYGPENKKITQLGDRLGTPLQYEQFGFTHHTDNINKGVQCSAYKILPSMEEKLMGQMEIARKVRAVDMNDVAKLVLQKHFIRDIKGNFRKFSMQQFRCVKCNEKYRRPPLTGRCKCNGKLIFTISEGSVVKYLGVSLMLSEKYDFSPYLKQTLNILKFNIDHLFGKEKEKQSGLGDFIG
ncbi:DNA polymerase II large subunit [Candidatus Woesearchaeota archaeon]|nr:DNA polymerase II large subunit [Candidatus Woesearchaeota archaeon]